MVFFYVIDNILCGKCFFSNLLLATIATSKRNTSTEMQRLEMGHC